MATSISLRVKLVYEDATSRNYTFNGVASNVTIAIKPKIIAINEAIEEQSADGIAFQETFVSDNGSPCIGIREARLVRTEQEVIYSAS